jgi:hypothetical protein
VLDELDDLSASGKVSGIKTHDGWFYGFAGGRREREIDAGG